VGIRHAFTSAKPQGADATRVRRDDWNAPHPITSFAFDQGVISPAQIAANQNDYDPTGWNGAEPSQATVLRVSSDRLWRDITGLAGGSAGRLAVFTNIGDYCISFLPESTGSTAANRFLLQQELEMWPGETLAFWYDATSSRWRVFSNTFGRADSDFQDLCDDFMFGSVETGEFGELAWSASGNLGTHVQVAGTANNPGILRIVTGATSGNRANFHPGNGAAIAATTFAGIGYFQLVHRSTDRTTNLTRVGLGTDVSSTTHGTDGLWVESTNGGNWLCFGRNNGASTSSTDTGAAATANNWFRHEFYRVPSTGDWEVYQNKVRVATYTSAQGPRTTIAGTFGGSVAISAASARNIEIDYARVRLGRFTGQRWT
jgi:hypothetical protein